MSKNFSAPMSAPKPASVQTIVARREGEPIGQDRCCCRGRCCANGPEWTKAGAPSSVCSRFGLMASLSRTVIAPAHAEVFGGDRRAVVVVGRDHPAEGARAGPQVRRQREDGHDLRGDGDLPLGLARRAVRLAAQADDDVTQRAVVDVDDARPGDRRAGRCRARCVVQVVVEEGGRAGCAPRPIAWLSPVRWRLKSSIGMTWL